MTAMFSNIETVIKVVAVLVPSLALLFFTAWLIAIVFVAKNAKKLLARFTGNNLPHGPRDPWPTRAHTPDR